MKSNSIIYLVDADKSARGGLERLLLAAGYGVFAYASTDDLLKDAITTDNACFVIDLKWSDLSKTALWEALAGFKGNAPMIFLSAGEDAAIRQKAASINSAGFFHKPVDGPALLDAISWAMDTH